MKRAWWLAPAFVVILAAPLFAGDIQVLCEPGLRIYLDGEFKGLSTAKEDGLYLTDVTNGQHRLWVEKDGFLSQSFAVDILNAPIEVKVGEFEPLPQAPAEQEQPAHSQVTQVVGSVVILSAPQNCTVEIDGEAHSKDSPRLSLGGLAVGEHTISFSKKGFAPISGVVKVEPGAEVTVRGNLMEGQVEVVHEGKGSLRVYSKPAHCTLRFMGRLIEKTDMVLNLAYIPAGSHPLTASWAGRTLSTSVSIRKGQRTIVTISFAGGSEPFVVSYEPE